MEARNNLLIVMLGHWLFLNYNAIKVRVLVKAKASLPVDKVPDEVKYQTHRDENDQEEHGDDCEVSVACSCIGIDVGFLIICTNTKHILVRISQVMAYQFIVNVVEDTEHQTAPCQHATDPNYF